MVILAVEVSGMSGADAEIARDGDGQFRRGGCGDRNSEIGKLNGAPLTIVPSFRLYEKIELLISVGPKL